jgi:two-component system response regulator FixJ
MDQTQPTIHVVDDDEAVRDSLGFLLGTMGWRVRTYASPRALLAATLPPSGCIVSDLRMPLMDGLELQAELAGRGVRLPIILMTAHGDVPVAVRAMKAGAVDFLQKPFADTELLAAVSRALARNRDALADGDAVGAARARIAQLTPREREVLDLVVVGKTNKEVARALGTSPRTIDVHRARVLQKLGADNVTELVRLVLAAQHG